MKLKGVVDDYSEKKKHLAFSMLKNTDGILKRGAVMYGTVDVVGAFVSFNDDVIRGTGTRPGKNKKREKEKMTCPYAVAVAVAIAAFRWVLGEYT